MLDIDFLTAAKPAVQEHLLYTYTHGSFVPKVKAKVRALSQQRDRDCREADYAHLAHSLQEPSLFGGYCVWVALEELAAQPKERETRFAELVETLRSSPPNDLFIYGRADRAFTAHPAWPALLRAPLTHLEEPLLDKATFPRILAYLATELPNSLTQLTNKRACAQSLQAWIEQEDLNLADFRTELDQVALLCVDATTHTFDVAGFRALVGLDAAKPAHTRWHRLLAEFLEGDSRGLRKLLRALDAALHKERLASRDLVQRFHRATLDLLAVNRLTNPTQTKPDYWDAALWSQLQPFATLNGPLLWRWHVEFAAAEPRLNQGGLLAWADFLETTPTQTTLAR